MKIPVRPKIYHITHLRNLPQILDAGKLWSDAKRLELGLSCEIVGMSQIKRRRLEELEVDCHPGTMVGQYVPFYFCPRSIMLYILHRGNHPDLNYTGGQRPMIHLQADLQTVVRWADRKSIRWAFSDTNAGARYASFFDSLDRLGEIDWAAVQATDFRDPRVKEAKQAEFLVHRSFPWELVERIGTLDRKTADRVSRLVDDAEHHPLVAVQSGWYY